MKKTLILLLSVLVLLVSLASCEKSDGSVTPAADDTAAPAETFSDASAPTLSKDDMIAKINAAGYTGEMLNYDYPEGENEEGIVISLMYANEARDDAITAFCFDSDEHASAGLASSSKTADEGKVCSLCGRWVLIGSREFVESVTK